MDISEDANVKSIIYTSVDIITSVPELVSKSQLPDVGFKKKEGVALVIKTFGYRKSDVDQQAHQQSEEHSQEGVGDWQPTASNISNSYQTYTDVGA